MIYFSNFSDQQIYRIARGDSPVQVTKSPAMRFAEPCVDAKRKRLICVGEDHSKKDREAINSVVAVSYAEDDEGAISTLADGCDFYSNAKLSGDGEYLAWLCWNHPNMPWDGTELWLARLDGDGRIATSWKVGGGENESISTPQWSPEGDLFFISDRTGWWNLYVIPSERIAQADPSQWQPMAVLEMEAEFTGPQWVFGTSSYAPLGAGRVLCSINNKGIWSLAVISVDFKTGKAMLEELSTPYTSFAYVRAGASKAAMCAGSPSEFNAVLEFDLGDRSVKTVKKASELKIDPSYISMPQTIEFPTEEGLTAQAFFYPPKNKDFCPGDNELPPLIVKSHGGPTSAASSTLSLTIQFWTSRGFAVVDVNYGGSTGFGKSYRERLNEKWGVVDVADCRNAAKFLAAQAKVDRNKLAITGGSAGGYTTLCALTFGDVFKAGASHYGVSDLEALAKDTHKFESRYLDRLVGPYSERIETYRQRSPINFPERLNCPVIFLQGSEDKVVPPGQSEAMVEALKARRLPVAYMLFEGEQHGFRKAENIARALEAELYFYSRVFQFDPADKIEPVEIFNLMALKPA
ncbi:MAG TPA: S9 family peptidase [Candidatus Obscuribacterales bacterium]